MLKVGVTGGIGSGKSTVCSIFNCLGIPVFNADEAGRILLNEEPDVMEQIKNIFEEDVVVNGKPDRKEIAKIVFNNPEKLAQLNAIIHPAVRGKFNQWAAEQKAPYVIDEAAILFETGFYLQLDYTILVTSPDNIRINRIMQRDAMDEDAIRSRMKNQWTDEEKKGIANFIIINDEIDALIPQVINIHKQLIALGK